MLRILAVILLIGHAMAHIAAFLVSWASVQRVFAPIPPWTSLAEQIITFGWLLLIIGIVAAAVVGLAASGWGLAFGYTWWRIIAIVSALISLVGLLPWLADIPVTFTFPIAAVDALLIGTLAFPWGDIVVHNLQRR